jgi:uncharacterized membrane protein
MRPLAILFGWLALAGAANAYAVLRYPAPYEQIGIQPVLFACCSVAYLLSSAALAVGLWGRAPWVTAAVAVWGSVLLATMCVLNAMIGVAGEPVWLVAAPYIMFTLLAWALHRFVRRRVSPTPTAT